MTTSNKQGIFENITNEEYHGGFATSSSQLKDLLVDPEIFYRKYITKEIPRTESPAFDIGSYYHCAILEPHKLATEFVTWKGKVRAGKEWEAFKEANSNKTIVTQSNLVDAETLIEATKRSPIAMSLLSKGVAEISAFVELTIANNEIYHNYQAPHKMGLDGWEPTEAIPEGTKIWVKVRADWLGETYILDLKSTSGNTKITSEIAKKIHDFDYDMSASLYLDIFNVFGQKYKDFYWTFASKSIEVANSKTYVASDTMKRVGRAKWTEAIKRLAKCLESNWTFFDELAEVEPVRWDLGWLDNKEKKEIQINDEDLI